MYGVWQFNHQRPLDILLRRETNQQYTPPTAPTSIAVERKPRPERRSGSQKEAYLRHHFHISISLVLCTSVSFGFRSGRPAGSRSETKTDDDVKKAPHYTALLTQKSVIPTVEKKKSFPPRPSHPSSIQVRNLVHQSPRTPPNSISYLYYSQSYSTASTILFGSLFPAPEVLIVDEEGEPLYDKYYEVGSTIKLMCRIRHMSMLRSAVYWIHNENILNHDVQRGGIRWVLGGRCGDAARNCFRIYKT